MDESQPTQGQLDLNDQVVKVLGPVFGAYAFMLASSAVSRYFGEVVFLNQEQFVRVIWSDFPTDYPGIFRIEVGWDGPRPQWTSLSEITSRANGVPHRFSVWDIRYATDALQTIAQDFVQYAPAVLSMTRKEFWGWKGT